MSDAKMLQAILDGQSALKKELKKDIQKLEERFDQVDARFDNVDRRIDKLGLDIAELSDDAPTVEEFDDLEKRVARVERTIVLQKVA